MGHNGSSDQTGEVRPVRVLVVDDDRDTAESLGVFLRQAGHEVAVALDGRAGIEAATAAPPEVVVLDIGLPGLDGYTVARRLRQMPALADATLVALSGFGGDAEKAHSRDAGFDYHLVKPVGAEVLQEVIATHRSLERRASLGIERLDDPPRVIAKT
jgi:two-component system CheB/CheR fusion protein